MIRFNKTRGRVGTKLALTVTVIELLHLAERMSDVICHYIAPYADKLAFETESSLTLPQTVSL